MRICKKVDVAGDYGAVEFKAKTSAAVVADVVLSEEHRYFRRDGDRVVDEHETLKCLVAFLVVRRCRKHKRRRARGMVRLPGYRGLKFRRKLRGAMPGCLEQTMREMGFNTR